MALIQCPDCGASVSDSAAACPRCARPIALSGFTKPTPPANTSKGVSAGFALLVLIALGIWIYYQATSTEEPSATNSPPPAVSSNDASLATGEPTNQEQGPPTYITTPAALYQAYEANEVATDQKLAGKIIQFTAPVKSIDKDFTDTAVLKFSTGDEFSDLQAALEDSDKAAAAQLSQGQIVTVRCEKFERVMDSPVGGNCTFHVGDQQLSSTSENQQSAPAESTSQQANAASTPPETESATAPIAMATPLAASASSASSAGETEDIGSGPSFDCSQANDSISKTICSNSGLSELDAQMAILYHTHTDYTRDPNARDAQRVWLSERE